MTIFNFDPNFPKSIIYIFSTLGDSNGSLVVNNSPLVANGIAANASTNTLSITQQLAVWPGGRGWFFLDGNTVFTANGYVQVGLLPQFLIPLANQLVGTTPALTFTSLIQGSPTSIIPELGRVNSVFSNTAPASGIAAQAYPFEAPLGFIYMNAVAPNANSAVYVPTAYVIPINI
jgi:hypothetical protein